MRRKWIGLLLLCLLAACTGGETEPPPTSTPTLTRLPTATPTAQPTPTQTATPSPTPLTCWDDGGIIVEDQVPSDLLPEPIPVLVYLPPCFFQQPDAQFPALYLIHGQSFTQDQWYRLGITELADTLIAEGDTAPFIIVMPHVTDWSQPGRFPFGQALVEEVLPYIEAGYRAQPLRTARAVGGLSRGGSWAIHLGTRYWQVFGAFGGHSAPVFLDDAPNMPAWLDAIPPAAAPRITLDIASSELTDIRRSASWFAAELEDRGIAYQFDENYGAHNEDFWGAHIEEYLRFYTANWKP